MSIYHLIENIGNCSSNLKCDDWIIRTYVKINSCNPEVYKDVFIDNIETNIISEVQNSASTE